MCVTIILHKILKDYPLIIGNNRDEMIHRKFQPPQLICKNPKIFAPIDLEQGGTWIGINENRILVNILNKWTGTNNFFGSKNHISRGHLVVELLKLNSISKILNKIKKIKKNRFMPFQMLIADKDNIYIIIKNQDIKIYNISDEKIFIIGNLDPFQKWEKYDFGYNFLKKRNLNSLNEIFNSLKELLSTHNGDKNIPPVDYAVDIENFKTTSSSIVAINNNIIYEFLNGFPGKGHYKRYMLNF